MWSYQVPMSDGVSHLWFLNHIFALTQLKPFTSRCGIHRIAQKTVNTAYIDFDHTGKKLLNSDFID